MPVLLLSTKVILLSPLGKGIELVKSCGVPLTNPVMVPMGTGLVP